VFLILIIFCESLSIIFDLQRVSVQSFENKSIRIVISFKHTSKMVVTHFNTNKNIRNKTNVTAIHYTLKSNKYMTIVTLRKSQPLKLPHNTTANIATASSRKFAYMTFTNRIFANGESQMDIRQLAKAILAKIRCPFISKDVCM